MTADQKAQVTAIARSAASKALKALVTPTAGYDIAKDAAAREIEIYVAGSASVRDDIARQATDEAWDEMGLLPVRLSGLSGRPRGRPRPPITRAQYLASLS